MRDAIDAERYYSARHSGELAMRHAIEDACWTDYQDRLDREQETD